MVIKIIGIIALIIVISMSIFVIIKINSEENNDNSLNDNEKFIGMWRLIKNEEGDIPDTTEETDTYPDYEEYDFFSNGTYYHVVDDDNSSGIWQINNSILILSDNDPVGLLNVSYVYVFSDDNSKVTLNLIDDNENFLEFEKIANI